MTAARDERLLAIVEKIESLGGRCDIDSLLAEFHVCRRTLLRDINRLQLVSQNMAIIGNEMCLAGSRPMHSPSSSQAMRRLAIISLLTACPATLSEVVEYLADPIRGMKADEHTVRTDLDYLLSRGYVEPADVGRSGYRLSGAFMPRFVLNCDELLSVMRALEAAPEAAAEPATIDSIRDKLLASVAHEAARARTAARRRYIKGRAKRSDPQVLNDVALFELASVQQRVVTIEYRGQARSEVQTRAVEPLGLVYYWFHDSWYLVARCAPAGEIRHFRLDRIRSATVSVQKFDYPKDFDLESYVSGMWGVYAGKPTRVRVLFHDELNVLPRLRAEIADRPSARLTQIGEGLWELADEVNGLTEFRAWLRSFGSSAVVAEPAELRDQLIRSALEMHSIYARPPQDHTCLSRRAGPAQSGAVRSAVPTGQRMQSLSGTCGGDEMIERLIRIVNLLKSRPEGMSVSEIACACEASVEMIRDDLERLSRYGRAPLACSRDDCDDADSGCADRPEPPGEEIWTLVSCDFTFPVTSLTRHEAQVLQRILDRAPDQSSAAAARKAVAASISALRSPESMRRAVGRRVVKAGRTIYGPGQEESKLDELGRFVAEKATIRMSYTDANGSRSERDICSVALVYDWRTCAWYLYGFTRGGQYRHFKVSRIGTYGPSPERIVAPDDYEVEGHVNACWGVEYSQEPTEVVVVFHDDFNVIDRMKADTSDRTRASYQELDDGSVIYRDIMPGWNEFRAWLATFGESAEVLAPEPLRLSMADSVERVLARYGV